MSDAGRRRCWIMDRRSAKVECHCTRPARRMYLTYCIIQNLGRRQPSRPGRCAYTHVTEYLTRQSVDRRCGRSETGRRRLQGGGEAFPQHFFFFRLGSRGKKGAGPDAKLDDTNERRRNPIPHPSKRDSFPAVVAHIESL